MILIKVGGGASIQWDYIAQDVARMKEPIVLVHGANTQMRHISALLGRPERILTSPSGFTSRYTDTETLDIFLMVYAGLVNKRIVATLRLFGVNAIGLSGIDGGLWRGKRKKAIEEVVDGKVKLVTDSLSGRVTGVNTDLIKLLVSHGYVPVLTAPAMSEEQEIINVDNDLATAVMAKGLGVTKIVFLVDTPGLLRKVEDEKSLIRDIESKRLASYFRFAQGRMKKKLLATQEAFAGGAEAVYFGDGRVKQPVRKALAGHGTTIHR